MRGSSKCPRKIRKTSRPYPIAYAEHGQLDSVITAIEGGASCKEVVIQLSAVSSALNRAGYKIVATAMRDCISGPTEDATFNDADALTTEDLEKTIYDARIARERLSSNVPTNQMLRMR